MTRRNKLYLIIILILIISGIFYYLYNLNKIEFFAETSVEEEPSVGETQVGETPVGETQVGETPVGETPIEETPVGATTESTPSPTQLENMMELCKLTKLTNNDTTFEQNCLQRLNMCNLLSIDEKKKYNVTNYCS